LWLSPALSQQDEDASRGQDFVIERQMLPIVGSIADKQENPEESTPKKL
jgi:hypothetical protein